MTTSAAVTDSKWFGGGFIYGTQVEAPGGGAPSILLPSQFATIQEASVDFTIGTKELRGIFEDPEDVAIASRKITGKIITGRVNMYQLNALVFGQKGGATFKTGSRALVVQEPGTVPSTPAPTITVVHAVAFFEDKGVKYAGTRLFLVATSSGTPSKGQYTYDPLTGIYTFSTDDVGADVLIDYVYTKTTGHTLDLNNLVMGSNVRPVFECLLQNPNDGDEQLLLYKCKASKVAFPIKQEDYVKLEIDFAAYANDAGQVAQFISAT